MVWLVGALLLCWLAWGPAVLLAAAAALCVPRLRWWVLDRFSLGRRALAWTTGVVVALGALVVVVPDGWLPVPPAPGVLAGPQYLGRPAAERPVAEPTPHPHLAAPVAAPGPLGLQPEVDTAWLGLERCGRIAQGEAPRLVAVCVDRSGPTVRLVDAEDMRPTASYDLPHADGSGCREDVAFLDEADRLVVATSERELLVLTTAGDGLSVDRTIDLRPWIPFGDCVVGLAPDWSGRLWWVSGQGLVGTVAAGPDPVVAVADLGEAVTHGLAVDQVAAYVVSEDAVQRLVAGPDGTPQVVWRSEHAGRASAPALVGGDTLALADVSDDGEMGVRFLARESGSQLCRQAVLEPGRASTSTELVPVGSGVVVLNDQGHTSFGSTVLGFTTSPGVTRVDSDCHVRWTNEASSPGVGAVLSSPAGLVYAWTKRPSLVGVSAWYLTAIDVRTGRSMWSVRTGTGMLSGGDGSALALAADGSAWMGTRAGLVRVRDRVIDRSGDG